MLITGEEVVSGIARNLRAGLSQTEIAEIYKDKPMSNMVKPCAFLHQLNADFENVGKHMGKVSFLVDIRVHPPQREPCVQEWCRAIANKVLNLVNVITVHDKPVKSSEFSWKVEDDVLHIIVSYSFRIREVLIKDPYMQNLYYGQGVK